MIVKARAVKLGDNVDTDVILPGRYLALTDPTELKDHAMEGLSPGFASKFADGAVIVVKLEVWMYVCKVWAKS